MYDSLKAALVITKPKFHAYMVPLGYLYVAAALKKAGVALKVVDVSAATCDDETAFLNDALRDWRPDVVITGTSYKFHNNCPSPTIEPALQVTRVAKELSADCRTLLIGPLNCVLEEKLLANATADALALGESEDICVDFCRAVEQGRAPETVPGLAINNNGAVSRTGTTNHPDLEQMPFPEREDIDFERYIRNTYFSRRVTEMLTSRGCPFNCTYCFGARKSRRHDNNTGKYFRAISPQRVVEEIDLLYNKWGVRGIKFADVEFCVSTDRVAEICELLSSRGYPDLSWRAVTRATSVGADLLKLMRRAGCRHIYYGVESGDPDLLEAMQKQVTLDEIREAFQNTKQAGIHAEASFLIGVPGETEASAQRTIRFARELDPYAATFHVFVPFPGIPLENTLRGGSAIPLDDWDVYRLNVPRSYCDIPADRLDQLTKRAYRQFYLRPRYIARRSSDLFNPHMLRFAADMVRGREEGALVRNMLLGLKRKIGSKK